MKKLLILLVITIASLSVQAQSKITSAKDTNTNATTTYITYTSLPSKIKSVQYVVTKISGTVAGSATLQGSIDGVNFTGIDTLTLSDQATNTRFYTFPATTYYAYRVKFTTSGTQSSSLQIFFCRRPDE
jgi:hypothetical protein